MLEERIIELARGRNLAAVTTLLPGGTPMTQPMWIDTDSEHVLLNTEVHRQKFRNVRRDPRVTVLIVDPDAPHLYVEVRGRVVESITGPEARAHIDRLSRKYTGGDYSAAIHSERVILRSHQTASTSAYPSTTRPLVTETGDGRCCRPPPRKTCARRPPDVQGDGWWGLWSWEGVDTSATCSWP
jgi:PPOX class probable F420-dependent enzyme